MVLAVISFTVGTAVAQDDPWGGGSSNDDPWGGGGDSGGSSDPWGGGDSGGSSDDGWGTPSGGSDDGWGTPSGGSDDGWGTPSGGSDDGWGTPSGGSDDGWGTPSGGSSGGDSWGGSSGGGDSWGGSSGGSTAGGGAAGGGWQPPPALSDEELSSTAPPLVRDGIYDKLAIKERKILKYDDIREADVLWSKRIWRVIDTREKMNQTFAYPEQPFVEILLDIMTAKDSINLFTSDRFNVAVTPEEVQARLGSVEEITVRDPVTGAETTKKVSNDFNAETVTKIRIKEDWVFDEESSQMYVRILGIAPIQSIYDDNDNYRGDAPMFWIYYPEIREQLSRYEVFNPHNDAQRMSWEDLFEMRYFDSYIFKESNVRDLRIADYTEGVDALLESERVKSSIFTYEHDLWSY